MKHILYGLEEIAGFLGGVFVICTLPLWLPILFRYSE